MRILSAVQIVFAAAVIVYRTAGKVVYAFQHLARAYCHAGDGIFRNVAGHLGVLGNELVYAVKQRAAAGYAYAVSATSLASSGGVRSNMLLTLSSMA